MQNLSARHQAFHALHQSVCFIIPNPWDIGSARIMAAKGAKALATTSAGHAFTLGRPDMGHVTRDEALTHASDILSATTLPVSGDFENGFGDTPDDVAQTVRLAGEIGLSGCSIEDTIMEDGAPAYVFDLAVERIKAGASAARAMGRPFMFCARADGIMNGAYDTDEAIRRLQAFEEAGADVLYAPLPPSMDELARIVAAVSAPVNALIAGTFRNYALSDFANIGVRRLSLGSTLARVTHQALVEATQAMLSDGDFSKTRHAASGDDIDALLIKGAAQ